VYIPHGPCIKVQARLPQNLKFSNRRASTKRRDSMKRCILRFFFNLPLNLHFSLFFSLLPNFSSSNFFFPAATLFSLFSFLLSTENLLLFSFPSSPLTSSPFLLPISPLLPLTPSISLYTDRVLLTRPVHSHHHESRTQPPLKTLHRDLWPKPNPTATGTLISQPPEP